MVGGGQGGPGWGPLEVRVAPLRRTLGRIALIVLPSMLWMLRPQDSASRSETRRSVRRQADSARRRPVRTASARAWWSFSFWSAYRSANSASARSKTSPPPR